MSVQRGLSVRRQLGGFALAIGGGLLLLLPLRSLHGPETITVEVLSYQLLVVAVALVGGIWPALAAAAFSGVVLDLAFIAPYREITIADPIHLLVLLMHVAIAVLVSFVVGRGARTRRRLEETVDEIETVTGSDRLRGALLSALSHDLRRPLASATAAVGGLRTAGSALSDEDRAALLETADESLAALSALITDLLDASRLQSGVLAVAEIATDPAEVILPALDELDLGPGQVRLALGHGDALVRCDPVLLQRALVNLITNAARYAPAGSPVLIETASLDGRIDIRIIDEGPGIPADRVDRVFLPFQRLGDTDNTTGLGLGLALSRGFVEAMRGELRPEQTPTTGLTMIVTLPAADAAGQQEGAP
ncbi:sensor histidine kinase [Leucobacter chironomi]|uniref:sensor histidine kinase n=1 Tax=Leucobacter chironomi TaxID=491918 RepID=UPI000412B7B8|nr:ATP-binding protein [Leucobacter chironomi]